MSQQNRGQRALDRGARGSQGLLVPQDPSLPRRPSEVPGVSDGEQSLEVLRSRPTNHPLSLSPPLPASPSPSNTLSCPSPGLPPLPHSCFSSAALGLASPPPRPCQGSSPNSHSNLPFSILVPTYLDH